MSSVRPQFSEIVLNLPNKKTFTVKATNLSYQNIYIEKVLLNGKDHGKEYITHQELLVGGSLEFVMSAKPGKEFTMN